MELHYEASELGWAPGHWPSPIRVEHAIFTLQSVDEAGTHTYTSEDGKHTMVVWND